MQDWEGLKYQNGKDLANEGPAKTPFAGPSLPLAFHRDGHGLCQSKAQRRFGRNGDFLLTGRSGSSCAGACACRSTDHSTLAASGDAANKRTQGSASADQLKVPLVVIGAGPADSAGLDRVGLSTHFNRAQRQA